jgi:hypothetical protein
LPSRAGRTRCIAKNEILPAPPECRGLGPIPYNLPGGRMLAGDGGTRACQNRSPYTRRGWRDTGRSLLAGSHPPAPEELSRGAGTRYLSRSRAAPSAFQDTSRRQPACRGFWRAATGTDQCGLAGIRRGRRRNQGLPPRTWRAVT